MSADLTSHWCWPVHPRPQPGELFSCWLLRTARANRVKLTAFMALTLGDKTLLRRDMDRSAGSRDLVVLALRTAQAKGDLQATTFQALVGRLSRRVPLTAHARWVLPFGLWRGGGRISGIPFCPRCLEASEPHYRLLWRCSFAPACLAHGTLLEGACPHCLTPVLFHKLEFGAHVKNELARTPITTCWRCQGDVREAEEYQPAPALTLWTQGVFQQALETGQVTALGQTVPATGFAEVAYELLGLLSRGAPTEGFRNLVAEGAGVPRPELGTRHRYLEALPVTERARVLAMLGWLLQDWPGRLVDTARGARLSRSQFTRHLDPATVPDWYTAALEPLTTGHGRPRGQKRRKAEGMAQIPQEV